jgi:CubicO group peptidase (beta-lactamase class C family)
LLIVGVLRALRGLRALRVDARRPARPVRIAVSAGIVGLLAWSGGRATAQGPAIKPPARVASRAPAQLIAAADAILSRAYPIGEPGAVALIARGGRTIFRRATGLADLEFSIMLEPDMIFRIGSLTKQFTAAGILLLADRGKLALDDDITRYVPDLETGGQRITLEHLLTHTSGIANYTDLPAWRASWGRDLTPPQIIDLFRHAPLTGEPGAAWRYSNSGYILLGAVIEKVTGQTYAAFMRNQVFLPLGLTQTMYDDPRKVMPRRARGYVRNGDEFENAPYLSMTQAFSAGALVSTVDDLARWDAALTSGRLLSAASIARMFTPFRLSSGESSGYGLGWQLASHEGHAFAEHGGGIPGFASDAIRLPDDGTYVAVLSNQSSGMARRTARLLAALAIGRPFTNPKAATVPAETLDSYAGTYRHSDDTWIVSRAGSLLRLSEGSDTVDLTPSSSTEFFEMDGPLRVTFAAEADGGMKMTVGGWGEPAVATRTAGP